MERGLYIAASGMLADQLRQDVIANNLANATTAGYKGDQAVGEAFSSMLLREVGSGRSVGSLGTGTRIAGVYVNDAQGVWVKNNEVPVNQPAQTTSARVPPQ